ncbi:uroporphyrinogen-III synthase [Planococcus sp. APC 3906]|uniref:uroporphyrinogen-III synthase n=1 Tax=Planococcus sp. APC 3906 TaxID=3035194 RepID=UPI0025B38683|nr:uroporphyrinogen-III synthase [Planococcus sp. APC 3906]MDN3449156.1 uroporphyrinogen-III synthase [Planococcus sp. APC 3906]
MSEKLPLTGETIIFTGSKEPERAMALTASLGGEAIYLPLIETSVRQSQLPDFDCYGWLIFTSANSADAFGQLHIRTNAKIAAVGEKTADKLAQYGYETHFMPSVYSADVFVQEFPAVAGDAKCLFIKGSLAKNTIASMPLQVDEWIIYETALKIENARELCRMRGVIVVFASPSAVRAYAEAGGDFTAIRTAAIGHVTKEAISTHGGRADFIPEKYTYTDLVNEIAKGSCTHD